MKKKKRNNVTRPRLSTHSILYKCPLCEVKFSTENDSYTVEIDEPDEYYDPIRVCSPPVVLTPTKYTISFGMTQQIAEHLYNHYHPGTDFPQVIAARGGIVYASDTLYELD